MVDTSPLVDEIPSDRARLHLRLLGPPVVTLDGEPFVLPRRQARALLYYLATNRSPMPREQLMYLLWPDTLQTKARRNLIRLLSYLRRALPEGGLQSDPQGISLNFELVWCDSRWFEQLCVSGDPTRLAQATDLYRGPFLHGFSLPDSPEFDLWLSQEQGRYERLYLSALARLVEEAAEAGDQSSAIEYAQNYLAVDDLAEEIHRRLITLYGAAGDRAGAQRQFEQCMTILERELGVAPLPETRAAFEAAFREPADEMTLDTATAAVKPVWATLPTLELPLIGREQAWQQLSDGFQRYHTGGFIFIAGEPGIGKSRLLQEFATGQADRLVLTGNSHETTQDLPYQPLTQAMRLALEQPSLWAGIQPIWLAEATRILPELRVHFPDLPEPVEVEPNQAQARLFEALSQIFLEIASKKPLLLCLDDLHWADEATLGWLNYLSGRLAGSEFCLLATYLGQKAESLASLHETLSRAGIQTAVTLTGLTEGAIERLIEQLSDLVPEPRLLATRLRQATAGNPFFALETIRSLWESGRLASPPAQLPLPRTVQEAIRGRLAWLEPIGRQILDAAAVLSPDLQFEVMGQTAGRSEAEALDGLDRLLEHQILLADPGGLRFQHDLFRTVVYEDLNQWRRRSLHRRAAEALIEYHRQDPEPVAAQVARHYDTAGEAEQAVEWYVMAAEVAQSQYANAEAIDTLERAIALLGEIPEDREQATRLYESLGDRLVIAGQMQEADAAYRSALAQCPDSDRLWLAGLYQKLVHIYPPQGRMGESDAIYQEALDALGPESGDLPAVDWWRAWLDVQLSRYETLYYQGRIDEMEKLAAQIEPVLEQFGAANQHVDYNTSRVMLVLRQKRFNLSPADLVFSVKAAEFAATVASEMKLAYMEFGLGFGYLWAGQRDQAGEHLRLSLAKAEAMAYLPLQDQCLAYLTIASRLAGDVPQARYYQARSAEVAQLVGTPYYLGVAEANQAWLHYLDKQWDLATASARKALERWQAFVYPFHWLAHWPILAINLARDDLAGAVDSAAAMLDPGQQRLPDDVNDALERAVQAWESGKPDTSRRALEQVLILARDHCYL